MNAEGDWHPTRLPCGHEVADAAQVHYCGYVSLAAVGGLADPYGSDPDRRRDPLHPDERQFVVVHQLCELAFLHLCAELRRVIALMDPVSPNLVQAAHLMEKRVNAWLKLATSASVPLHTMHPADFLGFRDRLAPASGMESPNFRRIELLSGIRPDLALTFPGHVGGPPLVVTYRDWLNREPGPGVHQPKVRLWIAPEFDELAAGPTLASRFETLLATEGFDAEKLYAWYDEFAKHDWSERSEPLPEGETEERRLRLKKLADALYLYEQLFRSHRKGHLDLVRKQVDDKPGTAGTDGVPYLRAIVKQSVFFPDLCRVKDPLVAGFRDQAW